MGDTPERIFALTDTHDRGKVPHMRNFSPTESNLLTTQQVAELKGWSVTSINRWALLGELPATKLPGRTGAYLFDRSVVEMFARQKSAAA